MIGVGGTPVKNFKNDFKLNDEIISVEFVTMNVVDKQLFQAYFMHEGKRIRIHLQINEQGDFKIKGKDKGVCPEKYLPLEEIFDAAIKQS